MTSILPFARKARPEPGADVAAILDGFSIEVMPRTAARVEDFGALLPAGTLVYLAHIDGTPIEDMLATAARLRAEGFAVMPHLPARSIPSRAALETWTERYAELGIDGALVLAGGAPERRGPFASSMDLLETGLFERAGFTRIHVAGHPEGNRDIDPAGGETAAMAALRWKADYARRTGVRMAVATQFAFEAAPVLAWCDRLAAAGITLPVHVGVAGPAKLQTLIKYAMACGVGPSIRVLQRRAADLSKLVMPFTPDAVLADLAAHKAARPGSALGPVHVFPLGGIGPAAEYLGAAARAPGRRVGRA